jgi:hypothetical protein
VGGGESARAITIDEFEADRRVLSLKYNVVGADVVENSRVVGGQRRLSVLNTSESGGEASLENRGGAVNGVPGRVLSFGLSNNSGVAVVTWDGTGSTESPNPRGLGSIDLTSDGGTQFILPLVSFDNADDLRVSLRLYDSTVSDGSKFSQVTVVLDQKWTAAKTFPLTIPFTLFTSTAPSSVPAPSATKPFDAMTVFGPGGAVDIRKVGAIVLTIQGFMTDAIFGPIVTDGNCEKGIPKSTGGVVDRCGVCLTGPVGYNYEINKAFDACGLCPGEKNYQMPGGIKDACGVCLSGPAPYTYVDGRDQCGFCPGSALFGKPKDECGFCANSAQFGKGRDSCGFCPTSSLYGKPKDECGLCPDSAEYGKGKDECGQCFGDGTTCARSCVVVEATADVKEFERGLVRKARTLRARYLDERARSERVKCGISTTASLARVEGAYKAITERSKEIFSRGVEVCGDSCVTVSYAEQVEALLPQFKVIENQAVALAKRVKGCYTRLKIPRGVGGVQGVAQTVGGVNQGLQGLIERCRAQQVCPPGKK